MADLQQIVGAILRDLAKARFSADIYSRSISRYYESDPLLRRFPIPRADVEEVNLDLKFSVADANPTTSNHESREANAAVLFERSGEQLVATFLNLAAADATLQDLSRKYMSKSFLSTVLRIEMRQQVLKYFSESYRHFIDDEGRFHAERVLADLERPFRWAMEAHLAETFDRSDDETMAVVKTDLAQGIESILKHPDVKRAVEHMGPPILDIWVGNSDHRLEVLIQGTKLAALSEAAISSLNIKAVVRNMVWNEVHVGGRTKRRELTTE